MICGKCGQNMQDGKKFCDNCGTPLPIPMGQMQYQEPAVKKNNKALIIAISIIVALFVIIVPTCIVLIFSGNSNSDAHNHGMSTSNSDNSFSTTNVSSEENDAPTEVDEDEQPKNQETLELKLNKRTTVGDMLEITLESAEWSEEIIPSAAEEGSYYSYYDDKEGETYFVVKGKVKNLAGENLNIASHALIASMSVNGKYKASMRGEAEATDGRGFYASIKPLQELDIIIYASVADDVYKIAEKVDVTLKIATDSADVNEYFYGHEDDIPHNTYMISFEN